MMIPLQHARQILERDQQKSLRGPSRFRLAKFERSVRDIAALSNHEQESSQTIVVKDRDERATKGISFGKVSIQEYPIIVGDNPACLKGVPLTIHWESIHSMEFDLGDFEQLRVEHRRTSKQLQLPASHREAILRRLGFLHQDLLWGQKRATIARNARRKTNDLSQLDPLHLHL